MIVLVVVVDGGCGGGDGVRGDGNDGVVLEVEVAVSVVMSVVVMVRSAECGGCCLPSSSSLRKQNLFHYMSLSF